MLHAIQKGFEDLRDLIYSTSVRQGSVSKSFINLTFA